MDSTNRVGKSTYWIGVEDRTSALFERLWPLPMGVAYNSYIVLGASKTALIDTVPNGEEGRFIDRVDELLNGRPLDYLVINHMEPDHSGCLAGVLERYPGVVLLGNKQTRRILDNYRLERGGFRELTEGEERAGGGTTLRFYFTPWVHWPETMMTYIVEEGILFSGDAFGAFGAHDGALFDDEYNFEKVQGEMRRYYSNIVGKYGKFVQRALAKVSGVKLNMICATHGPIWRSHVDWVVAKYDKYSRQEGDPGVVMAVASMYGSTMHVGEYIARRLAVEGVKRIALHDVSTSHASYIINDVWKYNGLVLGSVTYNTGLFPLMQGLCDELLGLGVQNKELALFGSGSWGGGALTLLKAFAEKAGISPVVEPLEMIGRPTMEVYRKCDVLAAGLAERVLAASVK